MHSSGGRAILTDDHEIAQQTPHARRHKSAEGHEFARILATKKLFKNQNLDAENAEGAEKRRVFSASFAVFALSALSLLQGSKQRIAHGRGIIRGPV